MQQSSEVGIDLYHEMLSLAGEIQQIIKSDLSVVNFFSQPGEIKNYSAKKIQYDYERSIEKRLKRLSHIYWYQVEPRPIHRQINYRVQNKQKYVLIQQPYYIDDKEFDFVKDLMQNRQNGYMDQENSKKLKENGDHFYKDKEFEDKKNQYQSSLDKILEHEKISQFYIYGTNFKLLITRRLYYVNGNQIKYQIIDIYLPQQSSDLNLWIKILFFDPHLQSQIFSNFSRGQHLRDLSEYIEETINLMSMANPCAKCGQVYKKQDQRIIQAHIFYAIPIWDEKNKTISDQKNELYHPSCLFI